MLYRFSLYAIIINSTCLLSCIAKPVVTSHELCSLPPTWQLDHRDYMLENRGQITVLVFLKAAEKSSIKQAEKLEKVRFRLQKSGVTDVSFLVINNGELDSLRMQEALSFRVGFQVLQEQPSNDIAHRLGALTGNMFIYDRCSKLSKFEESVKPMLPAEIESVIDDVHISSQCGSCDFSGVAEASEPVNAQTSRGNSKTNKRERVIRWRYFKSFFTFGMSHPEQKPVNTIKTLSSPDYLVLSTEQDEVFPNLMLNSEDFDYSGSGDGTEIILSV